ncbi:DUF58 domain-containing protein [candidate division KSB1 bacterium]
MKEEKNYLIPEVLSKLSNLELKARMIVEGFITGLHKSPYHGFSVEFAEYRPYIPGDEIKNIDWKVFGRTDRFYLKEYEEETNLKSYILLDTSESMGYSSGGLTKLEYGTYLTAALTFLMLKQRDAVGLTIFDDKIRKFLPPRSVMSYLSLILKEAQRAKPGSKTNISNTLHILAERIKRRGLIILISDLIDIPEAVITGLKHFRHMKHEVLIFHILDPNEINFPFRKDYIIEDMETKERMEIQARFIAKNYKDMLNNFINFYKKACRENSIDYCFLDTSTPFDQSLYRFLLKREKMM